MPNESGMQIYEEKDWNTMYVSVCEDGVLWR